MGILHRRPATWALLATLAATGCVASGDVGDEPRTAPVQRFAILLGARELDDDELWDPVDEAFVLGAELAGEAGSLPFGWEAGLSASFGLDEVGDADVAGTVTEVYVGLQRLFGSARVRPYVGAGLSLARGTFESSVDRNGGHVTTSDRDSSFGGYAHAGFLWRVNEVYSVGLDYRVLRGTDIDLFRSDGDLDHDQLALVLSMSF